jgi:hypothetical protein
MRVDDAERCRLREQVDQDAREHRMLDDIGEAAGVIGMPVIHRGYPAKAIWMLSVCAARLCEPRNRNTGAWSIP